MNQKKTIRWVLITIGILVVIGATYSIFFKPNYAGSNNNTLIFVVGALFIGALISFLVNKAFFKGEKAVEIKESSHTIVESMRKVFKIVTAEGHFNEIYNYEETSKLMGFIPTQKKALVIVHAKALIGYDFEKCDWDIDEVQNTVTLKSFPNPEVLSIDTDYKYYNIEENIFNKFSREDLARIQENGKRQVLEAARGSNLPGIAAEQMRTLLSEILFAKNWKLQNVGLITNNERARIAGPENFVVHETNKK